ncbi:hypothetical protein [Fictibacillus sp. NRS-1165]|uniref:hypothetical protein n=1 Tax=Fictibacillus sp. NRS-1165 TaxID=3144463 RepID=UPI003D21BB7F
MFISQRIDVIKQAFNNAPYSDQKEHDLVSRLRSSAAFRPHLIHQNTIKNKDESVEALALAPVSVLPSHQKEVNGVAEHSPSFFD